MRRLGFWAVGLAVALLTAWLPARPADGQAEGEAWTAYVTNQFSDDVTPIDLDTNTPGTPIPEGIVPTGVALTPNAATAYVANLGSDTVTPIDVASNTAGTPIPVGTSPLGIAITPGRHYCLCHQPVIG